MNAKKLSIIILMFFALSVTQVNAAEYSLDHDHTEIGFGVKHMVIAKVRGAFRDFKGTFAVDGKKGLISVNVEVKAASIDTRIAKRDEHLRSPDFFEVTKYPTITFTAKSVESSGENTFVLLGDLQIRDVKKEVRLKGETTAEITDPWGNRRVGILLKGKVFRKDYGLNWNQDLENGGLLIGDQVDISLEGEGILKK